MSKKNKNNEVGYKQRVDTRKYKRVALAKGEWYIDVPMTSSKGKEYNNLVSRYKYMGLSNSCYRKY